MIRSTLPKDYQDYYNDIDTTTWNMDKVVCLEKKKGFLGLYTRYLYQLPDAYNVLGESEDIYVYHYNTGKKRPTILCAPILGGDIKWNGKRFKGSFPVAKLNALIFTIFKRWNSVVVCTNNQTMFDNGTTPANFELALKNVTYNNLQALQFIKKQSVTIPEKIYALGVSLGALTMTVMTSIDDTISACALVLSGGPISKIVPTSTESAVVRFATKMKSDLNLTTEELEVELHKHIKTDTFILAKYIPNGITMQVLALYDTSVSTDAQKMLWGHLAPSVYVINKLGNYFQWMKWFKGKGCLDELHKCSNGHYLTFLLYPYLIYKVMKFFHDIRHS